VLILGRGVLIFSHGADTEETCGEVGIRSIGKLRMFVTRQQMGQEKEEEK